MAVPKDTTGRVVVVRDMLEGIGTTLKYTNYQLDTAGVSLPPHPHNWTESAGILRSVLTKEAQLLEQVAGNIDRWIKTNPGVDAGDVAAMRTASKEYKAIARSLIGNSKKARTIQSHLEVTGS
ncbi:hypothetical protein Lfu02_73260 [Longispora fulva]|uniref:Uncharacterized protein n=1 Tax=Longispora fulva TaxID=619741 RepID=A0A8J7GDW1_9ACTN|nr:hypothetical protein [Longispora fulva]MBG6133913.1 hypothetical protein [Longispora fulva]GIG62954.1 hypothetical protein Lfu02_73260 [Longispora fulva]